ncbi:MAG TPA: YlxR family protein [Abditibacteriaceae bacterium]|jgi:hypothetical protein
MPRHIPQRTCVACGAKKAQGELLRVVSQGGAPPQVDAEGRAAGRGAYLCLQAACIEKAWARRALERALKLQNPVDATLKTEILGLVATSDN